jgi:hypothetical protein
MLKRSLLSKNVIVLLFALFGSLTYLSAQEIGLQLYSLRNQFKTDVPGTLAKIRSWGIKEIEGGGTYGLSMDAYKKPSPFLAVPASCCTKRAFPLFIIRMVTSSAHMKTERCSTIW